MNAEKVVEAYIIIIIYRICVNDTIDYMFIVFIMIDYNSKYNWQILEIDLGIYPHFSIDF